MTVHYVNSLSLWRYSFSKKHVGTVRRNRRLNTRSTTISNSVLKFKTITFFQHSSDTFPNIYHFWKSTWPHLFVWRGSTAQCETQKPKIIMVLWNVCSVARGDTLPVLWVACWNVSDGACRWRYRSFLCFYAIAQSPESTDIWHKFVDTRSDRHKLITVFWYPVLVVQL